MAKRNPCTCVGPTLRFTAGECFTCGRLLASEIGRLETSARATGASAGLGALLHAVERTRRRLYARPPRPRPKNARRVLIDSQPGKKGGVRKSDVVRELEFLTRTF